MKKYKRVRQKSIRKLNHNNCLMELDTYFLNTIRINYADWLKMGEVAGWKRGR